MQEEKVDKKITDLRKHRRILIGLSVLAVVGMAVGLTWGWFLQHRYVGTVTMVQEPSEIVIGGEGGADIAEINLENGETGAEGVITATRVVSVKSAQQQFYLELAYTTNITGLEVKVYEASKNGDEYTKTGAALTGGFLNETASGSGVAKDSGDEFNKTYPSEADAQIQTNAIPLYWLSDQQRYLDSEWQSGTDTENPHYLRYFIVEATWRETEKETDLIYFMATNSLDAAGE